MVKQQNTDTANVAAINNQTSFFQIMMPLCIMVFCIYMCVGISLGVLPAFLQNQLHCNNLIIGIIIGVQSMATLMTRHFAGKTVGITGAIIAIIISAKSILQQRKAKHQFFT